MALKYLSVKIPRQMDKQADIILQTLYRVSKFLSSSEFDVVTLRSFYIRADL